MTAKINNKKTKGPKSPAKQYHQMGFAEKVAFNVGCTKRMVWYVLAGKRNQETPLAQKILIAAAVIEEQEKKQQDQIKRIVKP